MKPVQPEVIRGEDFVAVKTTYKFEYAAPGRKAGSGWTQLIVFPKGKRYFVLMDRIDSVNDSPEMFLRNDTPGCVRHEKGDTFSEMYLSYHGGPEGIGSRPASSSPRSRPTRSSAIGATRTRRRNTSSAPITCGTRRPARKAPGWPG